METPGGIPGLELMETQDELDGGELPLETVGAKLRRAREQAGLQREDIAARTKIAKRHLAAIEEERFSELASRTYAIGFARAYARAVDLDEQAIAEEVRQKLAIEDEARPRQQIEQFEPGDPARVPPGRLAWVAGIGAVGVIILLLISWRSFLAPQGDLPDLTEEPEAVVAATVEAKDAEGAASGEGAQVPAGPVVLTALGPRVWVKVSEASGEQLFQKEMAEGERYTVPASASEPRLSTARPDVLAITVGGKAVPRLAETPQVIRDVPVTAAALLERQAPGPPLMSAAGPSASTPAAAARPTAPAAPTLQPTPRPTSPSASRPTPTASPAARATASPARRTAATPGPAATSTAAPAPTAPPTSGAQVSAEAAALPEPSEADSVGSD